MLKKIMEKILQLGIQIVLIMFLCVIQLTGCQTKTSVPELECVIGKLEIGLMVEWAECKVENIPVTVKEADKITSIVEKTTDENESQSGNSIIDHKLHYVCDEEKKKSRSFPEESANIERYVAEDRWEEIYIYEEDGQTIFGYSIPRIKSYNGYILEKKDDILKVELLDWNENVALKADFKPVGNHYEFTVTECADGQFEILPRTIKFYREDKFSSDISAIARIIYIDEEEQTFFAEVSGHYKEDASFDDTFFVDYFCMEDNFIQDINKLKGKTAILNYTEYSTTYMVSLNEIIFDENEMAQRDQEIHNYFEKSPDSIYGNDFLFWEYLSLPYTSTEYEYLIENDEQKVCLGIEYVKYFEEGKVFRLCQKEGKENSILGYIFIDADKKTYYIDEPEYEIENVSYADVLQNAHLVSAMESVSDKNVGNAGLHETITIVGDTCEYRSIDNNTGRFLNIIWGERYGILRYESGYVGQSDNLILSKVMPHKSEY